MVEDRFKPKTMDYFEGQPLKGTDSFLDVYRKQLLEEIESKRNDLIDQNRGERMVTESKLMVKQMMNQFEVEMDSCLEQGQYLLESWALEAKYRSLNKALLTRLETGLEAKIGSESTGLYTKGFNDQMKGRFEEILGQNMDRVKKAVHALENMVKRAEDKYWEEMEPYVERNDLYEGSVLKKHGQIRDKVMRHLKWEQVSESYPDWLKNESNSMLLETMEKAFEEAKSTDNRITKKHGQVEFKPGFWDIFTDIVPVVNTVKGIINAIK
jgi:hypothetical protein